MLCFTLYRNIADPTFSMTTFYHAMMRDKLEWCTYSNETGKSLHQSVQDYGMKLAMPTRLGSSLPMVRTLKGTLCGQAFY